jgi:hypothetical protein
MPCCGHMANGNRYHESGPIKMAVTLGDIAPRVRTLEVACRHCERKGRLNLAKLIAQHGAAMGLPHLIALLSADCPRRASVSIYERCGAYFPQPEIQDRGPGAA